MKILVSVVRFRPGPPRNTGVRTGHMLYVRYRPHGLHLYQSNSLGLEVSFKRTLYLLGDLLSLRWSSVDLSDADRGSVLAISF